MRLHPTPLPAAVETPSIRPAADLGDLAPAIHDAPLQDGRSVRALLDLPGLLLVTTGQQAGLFTGPLYTIHKALSAAALARRLEAAWQRPVRALFWVPGDDHDYDEVSAVHWSDDAGALHTVRLPPRPPGAQLRPMWREPLGEAVLPVLGQFAAALPPGAHRDRAEAWLRRHYTAEATVAGAFGSALAELLAPFGVLVLDSTHPAVKQAAAPLMLEALARGGELDQLLDNRAATLEAGGRAAGVEVGNGATLVFLDDRFGRDRLVREGEGFRTRRGGKRYSLADLESIAAREPIRLSPNVLLRPVIESRLLPTVAYVAGPGELGYFRLLEVLYPLFGVTRQTPVPRWSGAIIEPHVERILGKLGASPDEVLRDPSGLERRIVERQLPEAIRQQLGRLRQTNEELYPALRDPLADLDPTLLGAWASARRLADWAVRDLERKTLARLRARDAVRLSQFARVRGALLPRGTTPQERLLNVTPFLARHGAALLDAIRDAAERWYTGALEQSARNP
jgi:bacillithiol biosynthesis cysteine-adding enzyme BshC